MVLTLLLRRAKDAAQLPNTTAGPTLLVGAWHLAAHQASCQALYNPRLTTLDLPEHLWATIRKYGASLAYLGDAARMDRLSLQVGA